MKNHLSAEFSLVNEFHGAEASLRRRQPLPFREIPRLFVKFEGPLQPPEDPATGPHPDVCNSLQHAAFITTRKGQPLTK
jgi:hypothetical protein